MPVHRSIYVRAPSDGLPAVGKCPNIQGARTDPKIKKRVRHQTLQESDNPKGVEYLDLTWKRVPEGIQVDMHQCMHKLEATAVPSTDMSPRDRRLLVADDWAQVRWPVTRVLPQFAFESQDVKSGCDIQAKPATAHPRILRQRKKRTKSMRLSDDDYHARCRKVPWSCPIVPSSKKWKRNHHLWQTQWIILKSEPENGPDW